MRIAIAMAILLVGFGTLSAQNAQPQPLTPAFLLGEDETSYEKLCEAHPRTLLAVSNNDIELALKNWFSFLRNVDQYAKTINFDMKGLKVWLHVFWNADGSVAHIGFFVMPNSRNVKTEELKALFSGFIRQYKPVLTSDRSFSHYTSAAFPLVSERK
jgi:hypothetical protein